MGEKMILMKHKSHFFDIRKPFARSMLFIANHEEKVRFIHTSINCGKHSYNLTQKHLPKVLLQRKIFHARFLTSEELQFSKFSLQFTILKNRLMEGIILEQ